ncbi:thioredoxin reductase (NADPH) [Brevinema andersonii]|uniref:Thioredoxin reductase n=1 Tax=Brevinema andersonii TaxID=34097 RepID=A0A1I1E5V8_BREAD|nr:thioredoxin-disulfide reductase [Brevinema andersonii]SFB80300.1 thioredoxin reductase (NADPH) [Brevinema andersonii]
MENIVDLAVIGAGPAGMTAAIYSARAGYRVCLFEQLAAGGQAALTHMIDNYPGFPEGINGMELADLMRKQVERFNAEFVYDNVVWLSKYDNLFEITTGTNASYQVKSILIATGTASKRLGVKGEDHFFGRGVGTCAVCDGAFYKDKVVAVIGGGNSALEESIFLSKIAAKVFIIHRRDEFRAEKFIQKAVLDNPKIEILFDTVVEEIKGSLTVETLLLKNVKNNSLFEKKVDGVFLYVGLDPNTSWLDESYKEKDGFISVDSAGRIPHVAGAFAAGDCCRNAIKQVAVAVGDGAKVSYAITHYLETFNA